MSEHLFDEFPEISLEEWMEKIKKDLKGKSPESLRWTSDEGLDLFPVFRMEDLPDSDWLKSNYPGIAPYLRGSKPLNDPDTPWETRHDFRAENVDEVIELISETGEPIHGIGLVLGLPFREFLFDWKEMNLPVDKPRDGIYLREEKDFQKLLSSIDLRGKGCIYEQDMLLYRCIVS